MYISNLILAIYLIHAYTIVPSSCILFKTLYKMFFFFFFYKLTDVLRVLIQKIFLKTFYQKRKKITDFLFHNFYIFNENSIIIFIFPIKKYSKGTPINWMQCKMLNIIIMDSQQFCNFMLLLNPSPVLETLLVFNEAELLFCQDSSCP